MSNSPDIRGLDLKIDPSVQKICEVYNSSSGSTRSVLYFLLLINVLALVAVLNSHIHNWADERVDALYGDIQHLTARQKATRDTAEAHLLAERINLTRDVRLLNIRNKIDKYQNVQVPILGNSFDMNNLGLISGLAFIIFLVILRFTLTREKNNLRLALQSISERYIDTSIEPDLEAAASNITGSQAEIIKEINKTRRKHHYNFLSMNEIFALPTLEVSDNALQNTLFGKLITRNLFYFPYFVYLVIVVNDLITIETGFKTSPWHTGISLCFSYLCLWCISYLCKYCNIQKRIIDHLFGSFYAAGYTYIKSGEKLKRDTIFIRMLYPVFPVYKVAIKTPVLFWKLLKPAPVSLVED